MKFILRSFSYIMHPLFMPLLGVCIYFAITPKFVPESFMYAKIFAISILTLVVPILFYFLLESINLVSSKELSDVKERRVPLICQMGVTFLIISVIINGYEFPELYMFFIGILIASAVCLLLSFFKYKASLHMVGVSGVLGFIIALSMVYTTNYLQIISLLVIAIGLTAASRLQMKAHNMHELVVGLIAGGLPQLVVFYFYNI
ncbi:hypothetical protein [Leeuwenhoekiella sp. W20_SRS_FM14]|uniref:hypothetical protein n=1 Tax=Leeuwenhoekiella sp. W20_SRS_FM14 TaxID=3240270 RepID=UPI003F954EFA